MIFSIFFVGFVGGISLTGYEPETELIGYLNGNRKNFGNSRLEIMSRWLQGRVSKIAYSGIFDEFSQNFCDFQEILTIWPFAEEN